VCRLDVTLKLYYSYYQNFLNSQVTRLIQVDIGGHPPFPAGSKQLSGNFGNLLFLAVFRVLNFQSRFEALNDVFLGMLQSKKFIMKFSWQLL
jgi:hypothetical protein